MTNGAMDVQDVCQDQVPLLPDEGGGLNSLHTLLGRGIDSVQFFVGVAAHRRRPWAADLLIRTSSVHAGVALDGSWNIGNVLVVGIGRVSVASDQGTAGQSFEVEAHLDQASRQAKDEEI